MFIVYADYNAGKLKYAQTFGDGYNGREVDTARDPYGRKADYMDLVGDGYSGRKWTTWIWLEMVTTAEMLTTWILVELVKW